MQTEQDPDVVREEMYTLVGLQIGQHDVERLCGYALMDFLSEHPEMELNNWTAIALGTGMSGEEITHAFAWMMDNGFLEYGDFDGFLQ